MGSSHCRSLACLKTALSSRDPRRAHFALPPSISAVFRSTTWHPRSTAVCDAAMIILYMSGILLTTRTMRSIDQ